MERYFDLPSSPCFIEENNSSEWFDELMNLDAAPLDGIVTTGVLDDTDDLAVCINDPDPDMFNRNSNMLICVICGDIAHCHNFDQVTCESCKAFFRRNAMKNLSNMKCRFSGSCIISPATRRQCGYCRLKKCFEMKMRKDWIRTDEEKQLRALFKTLKQQKKNNDQKSSLISIKEFNLVQRRKRRLQSSTLHFTKSFQTLALHRNLSENDHITINNVCNAYAKGKELVNFSHIINPKRYTCMAEFLSDEYQMYQSLVNFLKNIREFHDLDIRDQIFLIKRNAITLIYLHHILASGFYEHPYLREISMRTMGREYQRSIEITRKRFDFFMQYPQIITMAMVILAFGVNLSTPRFANDEISFKETKRIIGIQDFYVELLWKYLDHVFRNECQVRNSIQLIVFQILRIQTINSTLEDHLCASGHPPTMHPLMESVFRFT